MNLVSFGRDQAMSRCRVLHFRHRGAISIARTSFWDAGRRNHGQKWSGDQVGNSLLKRSVHQNKHAMVGTEARFFPDGCGRSLL